MNIQVQTGGALGTMQYDWLTLWDASLTQVACSPYNSQQYGTQEADYMGLTPGATYYISVDNYVGLGYRGTFTLCLSDQPGYNYYQGATVLTNLENWCSADAAYTTIGASADQAKGSCAANGPNYNRWFKFQAIFDTVTIQMKTGAPEGTLQYPFLALWNSGLAQLACATYAAQYSDLSITYNNLVVGNWYYISADDYVGLGYRGTFKICINNVSAVGYYSRANGNWNVPANWSRVTYGGASSASVPGLANKVFIRDNDITVTTAQSCAEVNISTSAANTSLTVDGAALTVAGVFNATNSANNSAIITVQNSGTITATDNVSFTRSGGNSDLQLNVNSGSVIAGNDLLWTSTAGTVKNNLLTMNNASTLSVARDATLNYSGGQKIGFTFNNSSSFSVGRDLTFTSTAPASTEMIFNNTAAMNIKRNIVRGATPYGILTFTVSATLTFNGTTTSQAFPASAGSGGDAITYNNVTINNTNNFAPNLTLGGAATINGTLTLTSGKVRTTAADILTMAAGTSTSIGSAASFIDGPVNYIVAASGVTTINFPVGKSTTWGPAVLSVDHSTATPYTYTAEMFHASASGLGWTLAPTIDKVSSVRYWDISRTGGTTDLGPNNVVTLYYDPSIWVTDFTNLAVVKNTSGAPTVWSDFSGTSTGNWSGSITSLPFPSFSRFTFGNKNGGTNPLPVELLSFDAKPNEDNVEITWQTASEKNCNFFSVERSKDGNSFVEVAKRKGAGNSSTVLSYKATDFEPYIGTSYYRLKETDFNGSFFYSSMIPVEFKSKEDMLSVYPTPSSGDFTVSYSGKNGKAVLLVIRNILGQEYYSKGFILGNELFVQSVSLSGKLPAGVYMVTASSDNRILEKRIVIK
jgi:hypothetical protein